ncbi:CBS domain-containing protein [Nocardioides terrae]|uniref:CBS domain-containing protein n=1 Tax=Nocardioides terrae TaxID=574651 RepID=A0A1I1IYC1_9ACTN|nr:CBS domain-containing protein [Nocardioides terrae]SFC39378.1 CBS domain-containing protein [Nocardioides terrae]
MTTARDIMTRGAECAKPYETLVDAARRMRMQDVGALPICGDDGEIKGMITDRDIVVKCIAAGGNPAEHTVGELAQGSAVTIRAGDSVEVALRTMMGANVRRLPVVEGRSVVGMVSLADLAMTLPEDDVGELVGVVSSAPPNN